MVSCVIGDVLRDASGVNHDGQVVYCWPVDLAVRIEDGSGVLRPIDPDPLKSFEYRYGVSSASSGGGVWAITIPRAAEQEPTSTEWMLRLPDGKTLRGKPPTGVGPYTVNNLLASWGWVLVGTSAVLAGAGDITGEVAVADQDHYDFAFAANTFTSEKYSVSIGLEECQAGTVSVAGAIVSWSFTNRSQNGIRIKFSATYSGVMTFRFKQE